MHISIWINNIAKFVLLCVLQWIRVRLNERESRNRIDCTHTTHTHKHSRAHALVFLAVSRFLLIQRIGGNVSIINTFEVSPKIQRKFEFLFTKKKERENGRVRSPFFTFIIPMIKQIKTKKEKKTQTPRSNTKLTNNSNNKKNIIKFKEWLETLSGTIECRKKTRRLTIFKWAFYTREKCNRSHNKVVGNESKTGWIWKCNACLSAKNKCGVLNSNPNYDLTIVVLMINAHICVVSFSRFVEIKMPK